jgi:PAS domain S-box-containing protein
MLFNNKFSDYSNMDIPVADINKTASNEDLHTMAWNHSMFPLFAIDMASGQLLDVNRASELLTGYDRAELIGMSYQLLFPENERSSLRTTLLTISTPAVLKDLYIQTKDNATDPGGSLTGNDV